MDLGSINLVLSRDPGDLESNHCFIAGCWRYWSLSVAVGSGALGTLDPFFCFGVGS